MKITQTASKEEQIILYETKHLDMTYNPIKYYQNISMSTWFPIKVSFKGDNLNSKQGRATILVGHDI